MVSALLTALSHNVDMLLFARALDGVQGAATGTASGALINMVFSPQERVKALGWWSLIGAGGPVIGVSLGAPIIAAYGWRALFWFQLVLILIAFLVVVVVLPRRRGFDNEDAAAKLAAREQFKRMDWIGSWSLSFAVGLLMFGLSIGTTWGWTNYRTVGCFFFSVVMTSSFVYRIRHAQFPLIPPHYFRRRNFVMPMILRATSNFAYFGAFFLFPLLMEKGYGFSISRVGVISLARPLIFSISSPIAGYITMRIGERVSAFAGAAFLTTSLVLFSLLHPSTGVWFIVLALALSGLGMGVGMPASSSAMANEVQPGEFGVMSAAQMLAVQVGEVAGIEVLVTIRQFLVRHDDLTGAKPGPSLLATFHLSFVLGAAVASVGVVAAYFMRAVPRSRKKRAQ
jgi:MFS family permease